jgi:hypothetical protein
MHSLSAMFDGLGMREDLASETRKLTERTDHLRLDADPSAWRSDEKGRR